MSNVWRTHLLGNYGDYDSLLHNIIVCTSKLTIYFIYCYEFQYSEKVFNNIYKTMNNALNRQMAIKRQDKGRIAIDHIRFLLENIHSLKN